MYTLLFFFFFFQAEDGIRDSSVTGVQTCALPISSPCAVGSDRTSPSTPRGGSLPSDPSCRRSGVGPARTARCRRGPLGTPGPVGASGRPFRAGGCGGGEGRRGPAARAAGGADRRAARGAP